MRITLAGFPDFACARYRGYHGAISYRTRGRGVRAFWKTLLLFAVAGPLVGLAALLLTSAVITEWELITHAIGILVSRAQRPPCVPYHDGIYDLRCFQQEAPLRLWPEIGTPDLRILSIFVMVAYVIGFVPALLAGFLVCTVRLSDNRFGWKQAMVVGTLIGLAAAAVSLALRSAQMGLLLFFLCLLATIVCWRLSDRWWQGVRQQDASAQPLDSAS